MAIEFYKYQGSGNDFIVVDDRGQILFPGGGPVQEQVALLCDRHFGIGADGLILIRESDKYDFVMKYYNADGREGSMCGNGGRCAVTFAKHMAIINQGEAIFEAVDGTHKAKILAYNDKQSIISLLLNNVDLPETADGELIINTGSPHLMVFCSQIDTINVEEEGKIIRYSPEYAESGINVNFVEVLGNDSLFVRTYERGVERETLSCGTGVTASSIAAWMNNHRNLGNMYNIHTKGGLLKVSFEPPLKGKNFFSGIWLTGPAHFVFKGEIPL